MKLRFFCLLFLFIFVVKLWKRKSKWEMKIEKFIWGMELNGAAYLKSKWIFSCKIFALQLNWRKYKNYLSKKSAINFVHTTYILKSDFIPQTHEIYLLLYFWTCHGYLCVLLFKHWFRNNYFYSKFHQKI